MVHRIPQHIMTFAGENTSVYKQFADYFNHYRSLNGEKGFEYVETGENEAGIPVKISFSQKEAQLNEAMKKEILRVSGLTSLGTFPTETWASNPVLRWAAFAVVSAMVDMVLPDAVIRNNGMFAEVRQIGWGDSMHFDVKPRDIFSVSKGGASKRRSELTKQYTGQITILPERRELTVFVNLANVLAGKESLAEFVMKVIASYETELSYDVYNAFYTAMEAVDSTPSTGLRVAGYSRDEFIRLAQSVQAWNGGARPIAVGTMAALGKVLPEGTQYRYDLESEYVKLGYIRNFAGVDLMAIPQIADWKTPFGLKLSDDRIWFVSPASDKIVKVVMEGNTLSNTDSAWDNANLVNTSTMIKSWGTGVATSAIAGVMTLG